MQTARPSRVRRPTYEIPRAQPAHHFVRRGRIASVALYAATFVSLLPVGCTVLGAPRLRDCRVGLNAPVRPDLQHPRLPRCIRLRPSPNVCNIAGTARAPLVGVREPHLPCHMPQPSFRAHRRGRVLDAPRLRYCRAALDASVRPDQLHPRRLRRARLASTTQRIISRGRSPRTICEA